MMTLLLDFWNEVLKAPVFFILSTVLGTYATVLAHKLTRMLKLKNEQELRDILHKSADNAINYAATEIGTTVTKAVESGAVDLLVAKAKTYVKENSPQTLERGNVTDKALETVIKAKVGKNVESVNTK